MSAGSRGADDGLAIPLHHESAFVHTRLERPGAEPKSLGGGLRLPAVCARSSTPIHTDSMIGPTGRSDACPRTRFPTTRPPTPARRPLICKYVRSRRRMDTLCTRVHRPLSCHSVVQPVVPKHANRPVQSPSPMSSQVMPRSVDVQCHAVMRSACDSHAYRMLIPVGRRVEARPRRRSRWEERRVERRRLIPVGRRVEARPRRRSRWEERRVERRRLIPVGLERERERPRSGQTPRSARRLLLT